MKEPKITEEEFLQIVDTGMINHLNYSTERHYEKLSSTLKSLSDDELMSYELIRVQKECEAYTWDLWDAAYLINGGCGDSDFCFFRNGLIVQGKETYNNAMKDAEVTLLELPNVLLLESCEAFVYIASAVWVEKYRASESEEIPVDTSKFFPLGDPKGKSADEKEEALARKYPKLYSKYWTTSN